MHLPETKFKLHTTSAYSKCNPNGNFSRPRRDRQGINSGAIDDGVLGKHRSKKRLRRSNEIDKGVLKTEAVKQVNKWRWKKLSGEHFKESEKDPKSACFSDGSGRPLGKKGPKKGENERRGGETIEIVGVWDRLLQCFRNPTAHKAFQNLVNKNEGNRAEWEYPFAVASINISFMLVQMLDIQSEKEVIVGVAVSSGTVGGGDA
ncbi:hypothetical protein L2E82_28079 [Cichorium intybus]|uniref:Uncharacterized protein n=1 Tax=Cichorium intybus TaxID=13427 RepID=A0ACB9CUZ2_CICIN|nr:hypothetical protein L2E82_28079 [Cichorium intybus]